MKLELYYLLKSAVNACLSFAIYCIYIENKQTCLDLFLLSTEDNTGARLQKR